ncbi:MAG: ABC transporter permease [Thermomicrobiales bacterium]|jgi:peptide/nickel transport system permease protein|nr:ABC transporter permease [Thermomicrobiales bacterium]
MASRSDEQTKALPVGAADVAEQGTAVGGRLEHAARRKAPGYLARGWRRFRRNPLAMASLVVFVLMVLFSLSGPLISKYVSHQTYENQVLGNTFKHPGETASTIQIGGPNSGQTVTYKYILGSDELGRDVLTRLSYGGRISLAVSFITLALALTVGLLVGSFAGYYGGWVDSVLMRIVDVFISLPGLFVLILISSMINNNKIVSNSAFYRNHGWLVLPFVIAVLSWTTISRLIRGEFLSIKGRDYVDAARVLGAKDTRIIFRHILPNVIPIIIVWGTLVVPGLILTEAALSYLGFGVQIPTPSWGNMLTDSQEYFSRAPYLVVLPGLCIYITVLAVNLMGNGLRDALDPRLND